VFRGEVNCSSFQKQAILRRWKEEEIDRCFVLALLPPPASASQAGLLIQEEW